jgi:hypothetical protein
MLYILHNEVVVNGPYQTEFYLKVLGMKKVAKINVFYFSMLLALSFTLIALTNRYVLTLDFYQNSGTPLSGVPDGGTAIYESMKKWIYLSTAAYLFIKISAISLIFYTALFLRGESSSFGEIFRVVVLSEYIFLIPAGIKVIYFHNIYTSGTLADWHKMYILSALSLFENVPGDWYYALQTLNIFEISYWFLLAWGLAKISRLSYDSSLQLVCLSYIPALLIWVSLVSFFSIMLFPGTA